jgi:hypothetical protein
MPTAKPESPCDVFVFGDEVESVITAVSAARAGARVVLSRRSVGPLGGLSVRGGLSYMDITVSCLCGLFHEFYQRAGVVRIGLNPELAQNALAQMLDEAGVEVLSGMEAQVRFASSGFPERVRLTPTVSQSSKTGGRIIDLHPYVVIDATPDADLARAAGVPYLEGLGGLLGADQNFLGVSPVFRITGVSVDALQAFEAHLRQNSELPTILEAALPFHPQHLRDEYVTRPTYAPPEEDYLDILNPVLGIAYHCWRHGDAHSYPLAAMAIDGGNISRLRDGSLGFNGLVAHADALGFPPGKILDGLIGLSQGGPIPQVLRKEMLAFENYLRTVGHFSRATVIPPQELYVRQTLTLFSRQNMTARQAIAGGVPDDKAVGTFSYWLDLRGAQLWKRYPDEELPKPVFNVGLDVALPLSPNLRNFAFVGRSAGYSPLGQGTGRIVQHNAMLGEGLGIAAALAALNQTSLTEIVDRSMPRIQAILAQRQGGPLALSGHPTWSEIQLETSQLLKEDANAVRELRDSTIITNC